jgi:hypothetical protein
MDRLDNAGRALEDRFFKEQDRILVEKQRELRQMEETKQALTAVSGITNAAVLQKLIDLKIRPEILASLAVVPLVEVAWADGRIEDKERAAIMEASAKGGLVKGSPDYQILERWLARKPEPALLEAWTHYVQGLCEQMGPEEREVLRRDLIDRARRVAVAAGGFLGLTSGISKAEQKMLDDLDAAFART